MDEANYPSLPPPLKYLQIWIIAALPSRVREFVNALWFAMSTREPLRYERVALTYHGYRMGNFFLADSGYRIRMVEQFSSGFTTVAKRMPTTFRNEAEALLRLSKRLGDESRNHTLFPIMFLWGRRMHISPLYHQILKVSFSPDGVIDASQQLIEGVAFLHENKIAHLDISPRNFLVVCNPALRRPRLVIMDMEYAIQVGPEDKPRITLWHNLRPPPEGKVDIDPFAFDMLGVGDSMSYFVETCVYFSANKNIEWPIQFTKLHEDLQSELPGLRPTGKEAEKIINHIYDGIIANPLDGNQDSDITEGHGLTFSRSINRFPQLANAAPLPSRCEYATEIIEW